ncbi:MAG: hypothetical protein LBU58_06160 [Clostridiales bacterium]|nr:hypothetical protein [Clostridiales bacterium]
MREQQAKPVRGDFFRQVPLRVRALGQQDCIRVGDNLLNREHWFGCDSRPLGFRKKRRPERAAENKTCEYKRKQRRNHHHQIRIKQALPYRHKTTSIKGSLSLFPVLLLFCGFSPAGGIILR